ncbi:1-aminocyclopropane-1-carboxylate deaminase/D-cysteine desulfhydrase [Actinocorallia longicatena]|uniref:Pyridoxal-phosphate dependent enzyme n=1 Tax=Actinocorallia longicatena TaxID=111803 RepID=A0ABP6Q688_9ACTN
MEFAVGVSPVVEVVDPVLAAAGVRVWLKRDDLVHPDLPGNKWRKLKYNLEAARGHRALLTFGGAYSNHLRAVAAAGHHFGFRTIGIVRGEERLPLNPSLERAAAWGMCLGYLDRAAYRHKGDPEVAARLREEYGEFYLVPEGGSNALGVRGCVELAEEIDLPFDVLCCPVGTGGTLAGLAAGLRPGQRALGFSALKGAAGYLEGEVERLQREALGAVTANWSIDHDHHAGGYARSTPGLEAFAARFSALHGLDPERVYVAKMLHGIHSLARRSGFPRGTRIVAVITGSRPPGTARSRCPGWAPRCR